MGAFGGPTVILKEVDCLAETVTRTVWKSALKILFSIKPNQKSLPSVDLAQNSLFCAIEPVQIKNTAGSNNNLEMIFGCTVINVSQ